MPDVSPVVDTNLGPAPVAPANPVASGGGVIGVMNDLAEMRNRQNANLLFQSQMSARHKLGEDLSVWASQGLSPEEQQERAAHQPYAPFVAPEISSLRQSGMFGAEIAKTQAEAQEVHARAVNAGMGQLTQALAATGGDQAKFDGAFKYAVAGYDPGLQADLAKAYKGLKTSLTADLPTDPEAAKAEVLSRTRNIGAAFGLPLDKAYALTTGGVAPAVGEMPTASGATMKGIYAGTGFTPEGIGPGTAEQERLKVLGEQQAGLAPSVQTFKTASGADQPFFLSGGANGAPPNASPLFASGTAGPGGLATPGAKPITGPSATDAKYQVDRGTAMAEYQKNLDERVSSGQQIMQALQPAWEAVKDLQAHGQNTGGLASFKQAVAEWAQGFKIDPKIVDSIIKLDDAQEISKLMVNTTMQQVAQQLPATSKLAVSEFNTFMKNNLTLNTDPRAFEKIMNFWSHVQDINRTEQDELNKHIAGGGNISEWPAKWQKIAEERGLVNSNPTGTAKGALGVGDSKTISPGVVIKRIE